MTPPILPVHVGAMTVAIRTAIDQRFIQIRCNLSVSVARLHCISSTFQYTYHCLVAVIGALVLSSIRFLDAAEDS